MKLLFRTGRHATVHLYCMWYVRKEAVKTNIKMALLSTGKVILFNSG